MGFASLVVLSYNRRNFLRRSLESLWANTDHQYQLIVMDDASNPETQEYVWSLVVQHKVSTAVFNVGHNMGLGPAMNRAVEIAEGDYIFKLDADLEYVPGWLSQSVKLMERPEVGCLGLFKYWHDPCHFDKLHPVDRGDYYEVDDFVGSAVGFRRDIWTTFGPWRKGEQSTFAEDMFFKQAVQHYGYKLALPKQDLATNYGFGEDKTSLIKEIDWQHGKHTYNLPNYSPRLFGPGGLVLVS